MKYLGAFLSVGLCVGSGIASAAMQVDTFQATGTVNNLANADDLISGVTLPSATSTSTPAFVDHYDGTGLTGNFANNLPIPGGFLNQFALHATCQLTIPATGDYTFGTNNDDGLRLMVGGTPVITDDTLHATLNFFGTVNLTAGVHALDLVFFEQGGGASVELYAKSGTVATIAGMQLVGDIANGGLACNTVLGITGTIAISGSQAGSPVIVTVTDDDLNTNPGVAETIVVTVVNDFTGESENLTLTETGPNTGIFVGALPTAFIATAGTDNDGTMNTAVPGSLTATYDDALDGAGNDPVAVTATAIISSFFDTRIPTVSTWGLILMSSLLGLMGIFSSRRRRLK